MTLFTATKNRQADKDGKQPPVSMKKRLSRADRKQIEAAIARANRTDRKEKSAQDSIPWVSDFREREEQFSAILTRRDERELLLLIGCLLLREEEGTHRLSSGDQQTLREAQRIVAEEFSFSLHLPADQIDDYIREKLNITRQG